MEDAGLGLMLKTQATWQPEHWDGEWYLERWTWTTPKAMENIKNAQNQ